MPHPNEPMAVRNPITGAFEVLDPGVDYAEDHPFVLTFPGAFKQRAAGVGVVESVEVATANPGEKRSRSRR
jgi:hypothetical protein